MSRQPPRVEIIAEAAQGFEGDPSLALQLTRAAVQAGADAVKFQLVYADELATPDYQHYELFRRLEMPREAWQAVVDEAHGAGRHCYFDVFGPRSLAQAADLRADGVKIHASDLFNAELVSAAKGRASRLLLALGGVSADELDTLLRRYALAPGDPVTLLYGVQAEPTPPEAIHLRRLGALRARFPGYAFGFMDHTDGASPDALTVAAAALPFGIACLEKHITLDRTLELEDYVSALEPQAFAEFVRRIRVAETALGTERLEPTPIEREYRRKVTKVVVAQERLRRGEVATRGSLELKRTSQPVTTGSLHELERVVGRTLAVDVEPHQPITAEMLA